MRTEPPEFPETTESGRCDNCNLKFDDLDFVWDGDWGYSECPECGGEVSIPAPEADYDGIAEVKAEAFDDVWRHQL